MNNEWHITESVSMIDSSIDISGLFEISDRIFQLCSLWNALNITSDVNLTVNFKFLRERQTFGHESDPKIISKKIVFYTSCCLFIDMSIFKRIINSHNVYVRKGLNKIEIKYLASRFYRSLKSSIWDTYNIIGSTLTSSESIKQTQEMAHSGMI